MPANRNPITMADVLTLCRQVEESHAVKLRLSINPRPRTGYSEGCIFLVAPYHPNGKRMAEVEGEQHLWPSNGHRSENGLWVYLITRLLGTLDEYEHQAAREAQQAAPEEMTPLEQYISRSF